MDTTGWSGVKMGATVTVTDPFTQKDPAFPAPDAKKTYVYREILVSCGWNAARMLTDKDVEVKVKEALAGLGLHNIDVTATTLEPE